MGIVYNEKADLAAKEATQRDEVDLPCPLSLAQLRAMIRRRQTGAALSIRVAMQDASTTFRRYVRIFNETEFTYGSNHNILSDTVTMRLRLGYKYYWEYGGSAAGSDTDRRCRVCGESDAHTLQHYVLLCPHIEQYRNKHIVDLTEQIIWIINNNKVIEIVSMYRDFAPRV